MRIRAIPFVALFINVKGIFLSLHGDRHRIERDRVSFVVLAHDLLLKHLGKNVALQR